MQYEEGMYYDPATGERVLLVDFAKWRKILNSNDDPIPEMPPPDHDPFCPQAQMYQDDAVTWWASECQEDFDCRCELIAKVREDERVNLGHDPRVDRLKQALDDLCGQ